MLKERIIRDTDSKLEMMMNKAVMASYKVAS